MQVAEETRLEEPVQSGERGLVAALSLRQGRVQLWIVGWHAWCVPSWSQRPSPPVADQCAGAYDTPRRLPKPREAPSDVQGQTRRGATCTPLPHGGPLPPQESGCRFCFRRAYGRPDTR
ncbi:hypothetical protein GCM10010377_42380 [Streptomyces viridiviolaceus]|nr:hypothetical protein GCM10010377_42380 [Streptomyces viridiviolaceus]